jgi:hypothetical protein
VMGRLYSIPLAGTAFTVAVDAFEVVASTAKPFVLHEVVLGQTTEFGDAQAELLPVLLKKGIGSTSGSGGATVTPAKHLTNDAAAGPTAEVMNTTQAVAGGGSLTTFRSESLNVAAGLQYLPPEKHLVTFNAAEALVISVGAPADSVTLTGCVVIEEL